MKVIKAKCGIDILIDEDDFKMLNQYPWYIKRSSYTFYAFTLIDGKETRMHRFILKMLSSKTPIDHKDKNGLNNQKENLRICSPGDNCRNRIGWGKSKYKGVEKEAGKWIARINIDGKKKRLGAFETEEQAALAFNKAAIETGNQFYQLNTIIN